MERRCFVQLLRLSPVACGGEKVQQRGWGRVRAEKRVQGRLMSNRACHIDATPPEKRRMETRWKTIASRAECAPVPSSPSSLTRRRWPATRSEPSGPRKIIAAFPKRQLDILLTRRAARCRSSVVFLPYVSSPPLPGSDVFLVIVDAHTQDLLKMLRPQEQASRGLSPAVSFDYAVRTKYERPPRSISFCSVHSCV